MLNARGVTLIELMVTLVIMAIGATLAAPAVSSMVSGYRVRGMAESILAGLNQARAEAVRRNSAVSFTLAADGATWTVSQVSPATVLQSRSSPDASGVNVTPGSTSRVVTFLPTGLVQSGVRLSQVTVSGSGAATQTRRINIFGGGLIRMCDPAISLTNDPRSC